MPKRLATLALAFAVFAPSLASAGSVVVNPVSVTLPNAFAAGIVSVQNTGSTPLQMQVTISAWSQTLTDPMVLEPTRDVVAYPSIVQIAPGDSRQIRIGSVRAVDRSEHAYRLVFKEIQSADVAQNHLGLTVLTAINMPVFVTSLAKPLGSIEVAAVEAHKNSALLTIGNTGAGHQRLSRVELVAYDGAKAIVGKATAAAWYVLPGAQRQYAFELAPEICDSIKTVSLAFYDGKELVKTADSNVSAACR